MGSEDPSARTVAVIVAAGRSERMGAGATRKPFLELDGRSLLERSCAAFDAAPSVSALALVVHADDRERAEALCAGAAAFAKVSAVVEGGATRADSVRRGARALADGAGWIAVHDAARALVEPDAIERVLAAAREHGGALLARPVADTLKGSDDGTHAARTVDRDGLWAAQTPQAFEATRFLDALGRAEAEGFVPTDCASVWERYVGPPALVEGDATNLKITTPGDLAVARALVRERHVREAEE